MPGSFSYSKRSIPNIQASALLMLLCFFCSSVSAQRTTKTLYPVEEQAAQQLVNRVLKQAPVIDGHNDLFVHYFDCRECPRGLDAYRLDSANKGHTDIPRWRKGGVGGQLLNVFGSGQQLESYLEAFDLLYQIQARFSEHIEVVGSSNAMRAAMKSGKIAILPSLEGATRLRNNPALLRMYYLLGLRSVTLAYKTNELADGSDDSARYGGLSAGGRAMVAEMNRLGILIDISHVSANAMRQTLEQSKAPVIFSHSNAYALCPDNRNVPDDVLMALKKNGGLIMLTFVPYFTRPEHGKWLKEGDLFYDALQKKYPGNRDTINALMLRWENENSEPPVTISDMADHFDYVKQKIGVEHIGIAGDFDGISFLIKGLEDVSCYPALLLELARRGWTEAALKQITSENFLRVFATVEKESARLSKDQSVPGHKR